jgi:hypothetical protein
MLTSNSNFSWERVIPSKISAEKREFLELCLGIVWGAYEDAGMPFGNSLRGFALWSRLHDQTQTTSS